MHKHFEELCALAATGQISGDSMALLDQHLKKCDECRFFLEDLVPLKAHVAPVVAANHARTCEPPEGIRERFLQRAAEVGLNLTPGPVISRAEEMPEAVAASLHSDGPMERWFTSWTRLSFRFAVPAAAAVLCGITGYWVALQRVKMPASPAAAVAPVQITAPSDNTVAAGAAELARLEHERSESLAQLAALTTELANAEGQKRELLQRLTSAAQDAATNAQLAQELKAVTLQLQTSEEQIARLTTDLSTEQSRAALANIALAAQREDTQDATAKVASLQAQLSRFQDLGIERDPERGIIAARNLHIIDVYDAGTNGNRKEAFGRVFYIEGKTLVFYAYDLPVKERDKKVEFQVWGEQAGVKSISLNLGTMQNDTSGQGRWLLTCNDQRVLTRINAIYVTREPAERPSSQPQGQRLMYAFLGSANHP